MWDKGDACGTYVFFMKKEKYFHDRFAAWFCFPTAQIEDYGRCTHKTKTMEKEWQVYAVYGTTDKQLSDCFVFPTVDEAYDYVRNLFADSIWTDCTEEFDEVPEDDTDAILEKAEELGLYSENTDTCNFHFGDMHFVIKQIKIPV